MNPAHPIGVRLRISRGSRAAVGKLLTLVSTKREKFDFVSDTLAISETNVLMQMNVVPPHAVKNGSVKTNFEFGSQFFCKMEK